MQILATLCNSQTECFDKSDEEKVCDSNSSTEVVIWATIILLLLYLSLLILRTVRRRYWRQADGENVGTYESQQFSTVLQEFEQVSYDEEAVKKLNVHLMRVVFTKTSDETNKFAIDVYDVIDRVHGGDKQQVFRFVHQYLDPILVTVIMDAKFPGMTQKTIKFLEDIFGSRWITAIIDYTTATNWLWKILYHLKKIVSLEAEYLDLLKDISMTLSIATLIGSPSDIIDCLPGLPCMMVICFSTSIVLPLLLSTFHLALNNPGLIFNQKGPVPRWKRLIMQVAVILLCPLNSLLLKNAYGGKKESVRKDARLLSRTTIKTSQECKEVRIEMVDFLKNDLSLEAFFQVPGGRIHI